MALDPEEERLLQYWSEAATEAMESGDQRRLERVMERMPPDVRQEAMRYATQHATDFQEELQSAPLDRERGTDENPEGMVTGFQPAGTEATVHGNIGDPFLTWRPEDIIHRGVFDRFLIYLQNFKNAITKELWMRSVLPPLRHTIGRIFQTGGFGEWEQESFEWKIHKINPPKEAMTIGGSPKSRVKQLGGSRTLEYRGLYRRTLTRRDRLNQDGNIFEPARSGGGEFSGTRTGWGYGFYYGIDQHWFTSKSRRERGDDFEQEYPSGFETEIHKPFYYLPVFKAKVSEEERKRILSGSVQLTKYEYFSKIRRVFLTSKDVSQLQGQGYGFYDYDEFTGAYPVRFREIKEGHGEVAARPIWGILATEKPEITQMKDRIRNNIMKDIVKYLDIGQKVHWYGARDSEGRLIAPGERHLLAMQGTTDVTRIPQSLRGVYQGAGYGRQRAEAEDIMFRFRELRAQQKEGKLHQGGLSELEYFEQRLREFREGGAGLEDVPF